MSSESNLWRYLKKKIGREWDATRHEDSIGSGVPDVSFGYREKNGWIELKYLKKFPARESTTIRIPHLTKAQCNWLINRNVKGRNCWILIQIANEYFLFSASAIGYIWHHVLTANQFRKVATGHWIKSIDKDEFLRILDGGMQ